MPSTGSPSFKTLQSLVAMAAKHKYKQSYQFIETLIHRARNKAVVDAVQLGCTHLMFIDDDMTFPADAVDCLVDRHLPVVGGLCFARKEKQVNRPVIKKIDGDLMSDVSLEDIPTFDEPFKVDGTGTGFLLIDMNVFKTLEPPFFYYGDPKDFGLKEMPFPEHDLSEDVTFMLNLRKAGIDVFIDPTFEVGHVGEKTYKKEEYGQRSVHPDPKKHTMIIKNAIEVEKDVTAGKVAIFVPTVDRPEKVERLLKSLEESTPREDYQVYVMTKNQDTLAVAKKYGATSVLDVNDDIRCATRMNYLLKHTKEPFIFTGSDDIIFRKDWIYEAKQFIAKGYKIISVNDRFNPNGTNFLVERKYIEEHSGCLDVKGVLFYPGYQHNFCDTELIASAKKRNVFAYAVKSIVEHEHWLNHKRQLDHSDMWARARFEIDKKTFEERSKLWKS